MPIIRAHDYVDAYRIRAQSPDIHELAGRPGKEALTEFVNSQIREHLTLNPTDIFVDIGCGDGRLLRKAAGVSSRVGITSSKEESERLQGLMPDITFKAGLVQSLPLETASVTKIVCNAVLVLMDSEDDVAKALREIARIARAGAVIWIGEIPTIDEYKKFKMYCGTSVLGLLWFLLLNHGLRTFLGMCRKLVKSTFGREQLVLNSARMYYSDTDHFIALAQACGLRLENHFKHPEIDVNGKHVDSENRFDYVFTK